MYLTLLRKKAKQVQTALEQLKLWYFHRSTIDISPKPKEVIVPDFYHIEDSEPRSSPHMSINNVVKLEIREIVYVRGKPMKAKDHRDCTRVVVRSMKSYLHCKPPYAKR